MTVLLCLVLISVLVGNVLPQAVTLQLGGNPERTLLSTVLAKEVNLLRYYEGMSMDEGYGMGNGKGKGKGKGTGKCIGHEDPKGCDKPSKKGPPDDKKGMGKGMGKMEMGKGMKQGMSMDKDKSNFPSTTFVPSLCKWDL